MLHVVSASPLSQHRLRVSFSDGADGIFDVEPKRRGGVFLKLLDEKVFNAVTVNPDFGCVEWPGGVDLSPEVMRRELIESRSEAESHSAAVLREDGSRNRH